MAPPPPFPPLKPKQEHPRRNSVRFRRVPTTAPLRLEQSPPLEVVSPAAILMPRDGELETTAPLEVLAMHGVQLRKKKVPAARCSTGRRVLSAQAARAPAGDFVDEASQAPSATSSTPTASQVPFATSSTPKASQSPSSREGILSAQSVDRTSKTDEGPSSSSEYNASPLVGGFPFVSPGDQ